ncbi:ParB/RepB/Spo0J family partition protein [Anaerosalibacter massiliensis]|uniref:ParB/RepB/Spo0J family partition protein n=1 Tax=Anaerosalibacter massiliensis TaxID=1347392 RepID=A0A9X2MK06_9FIRM|nr:ParB/RepB/Spo0J family partition protein [Anaerosalibacter massiliensis]MCR2045453.1 ParB/RepB/Spo0J family partition protein [Anaerosalibacter massiliensis]
MATRKNGLGKGLSALIPEDPIDELLNIDNEKESIVNIDISLIKPNKKQPRKEFDKKALLELSQSIKTYGVIQPIIVRKFKNDYEIVAGERRWKASQEAGLKEIPCIIKDMEELDSMKIALIENLQREDLNPIEEAVAFEELMKDYGLTQEEVAKVVGKSRSYIANTIRLLNLDENTKNHIQEGKISSGHGRALLSIDNEKERENVTKEIIDKKLNVRDTERLAKEVKEIEKKENIRKDQVSSSFSKDPIISDIEENLMQYFGTKVQISKGRNKGKIEIEYYDDEDLNRILDILIKE